MDPKRLLHPLLILGAFGLGFVLGALFFGLGGWGEATAGFAVYLLLAILGVGFGLLGLAVGVAAEVPDGERRREPLMNHGATESQGQGLRVHHRPPASGARPAASPPEGRHLGDNPVHEASVPMEPSPQLQRPTGTPIAPEPSGAYRPARESDYPLAERSAVASPPAQEHQPPLVPKYGHGTEAPSVGDAELGSTGSPPQRGGSAATFAADPVGFLPEDLIRVWEAYEAEGDGHFTQEGLTRCLGAAGLEARALSGEELGAGDVVLGVASVRGNGPIYVLPDFNRPSSAVSRWFEDQGTGVRTAAIKRLDKVAEMDRRGGELVLRRKGVVA